MMNRTLTLSKSALQRRAPHFQRGVTLTETLLVLAVAAILAAAAYRAYSMASNDARNSELINSTTTLVTKIKQIWGVDGDYSGINTSDVAVRLENSGVLPPQFRRTNTEVRDLFGNAVSFTGGVGSFTVGFTNLSRETCSALATSLASVAYAINVGNASAADGMLSKSGKAYKGPDIMTPSGLDSGALADMSGCGVTTLADRKLVAEIR